MGFQMEKMDVTLGPAGIDTLPPQQIVRLQ